MKKICVVGTGYVGMSLVALLGRKNNVVAYDIDNKRIDILNSQKSTIQDSDIDELLEKKILKLNATNKKELAFLNSEFIFIATPTDYDPETNFFDTSSVEKVVSDISKINKKAIIIIKSTVPVGFTEDIKRRYPELQIIFSPEFLREGFALKDNLFPSRIVVGDHSDAAKSVGDLLCKSCSKENIDLIYMSSTEAEAVKLFSNTYLAMRVSFFNELDSFSMENSLSSKNIIEGVCLDERIGNEYNNPSFGYGGYCLPKDTKQLLANYNRIPQSLIRAVVESNSTRKSFLVSKIQKEEKQVIGVYKLAMKINSDNYRSSAIIEIIKDLKRYNFELLIYEPFIKEERFLDVEIVKDFKTFAEKSELILANRLTPQLKEYANKVFSRDIFGND
tara:strand:- start:5390 stop:6559 length:1170 start_codon:yes stop_codon:yes gene_type:complete